MPGHSKGKKAERIHTGLVKVGFPNLKRIRRQRDGDVQRGVVRDVSQGSGGVSGQRDGDVQRGVVRHVKVQGA